VFQFPVFGLTLGVSAQVVDPSSGKLTNRLGRRRQRPSDSRAARRGFPGQFSKASATAANAGKGLKSVSCEGSREDVTKEHDLVSFPDDGSSYLSRDTKSQAEYGELKHL